MEWHEPIRMGSSMHSVPQGSEKGWISLLVTTASYKQVRRLV